MHSEQPSQDPNRVHVVQRHAHLLRHAPYQERTRTQEHTHAHLLLSSWLGQDSGLTQDSLREVRSQDSRT